MSEALIPSERRAASLRENAKVGLRARKLALTDLLATPHGRRYLWDELAASNAFAQTYVPDSFDRTAFQEGLRSRGLALLAELTSAFPSSYLLMTKENSPTPIPEDAPSETEEPSDE